MKGKILFFWEQNPALFYGLSLFLGCLFALQTPWALLSFILLVHKSRFFRACMVFLLPSLIVYQLYVFPRDGEKIEGIFFIHTLKKSERYGAGFCYSGILKIEGKRLKCRCFSKVYHSPNVAYKVTGVVRALRGVGIYSLKVSGPWQKVASHFSLAAIRDRAQSAVKRYIESHMRQPKSAHFLIGMVTGQLEDRVLMNDFSQLGLSHLMAISGLHFSLLALFFHLICRLFLPYKAEAICLIFLLTLYLLFIGNTASVLRAWISTTLFLLAQLLEKRVSSLNSLGVAALCLLLFDPLFATTLSFQLSFLATAGILFFYSPLNNWLCYWLPKKPLQELMHEHIGYQHIYIMLCFFREALALTLAVHVAILPLMLSTFHAFSFNSLFYNLFFPFLASMALLFFLISIPFGHAAHTVNSYYCDWILSLTESHFRFATFHIETFPAWLLATLLTLQLGLGVGMRIKQSTDRLRRIDSTFLDRL